MTVIAEEQERAAELAGRRVTPEQIRIFRREVLRSALRPIGWQPELEAKRRRIHHYLVQGGMFEHTMCGSVYATDAKVEIQERIPVTMQCSLCRENLLVFGLEATTFTILDRL